ncbi:pyridoxal phosphate-dependent transferase [Gaertneriomyces semiglobifer]|nr:pyridoxal phosphate-dependent transferase [Gaertneriomyces semiglobifer]
MDSDCIYLCGNSLGLQPKKTRKLLEEELDVWASAGVQGHFNHPYGRPWVSIDDHVIAESARIVGAQNHEVTIMNSLTANLHFLMISFYRPTTHRYKIMMEAKSFPSDYYAIESQVSLHGFSPKDAIIEVEPRNGEDTIRTEDILQRIEEEGDKVALVLFSGVQYYTGQFFELDRITSAAKKKGCMVGFDLAHAVGNVPLRLHDWEVDFACWCTYKYLNAGPGGIGGAFVHEKHARSQLPRLAGWWGTDPAQKFVMDHVFRPIPGANVYRVSNPNVLATTSLLGSLQVFARTTPEDLRAKSVLLTGYLEVLLMGVQGFKILTPSESHQRGCQLSLLFDGGLMLPVFEELQRAGIVVDERKPDVIRVAPTPLYNTFTDVWTFVKILKEAIERARSGQAPQEGTAIEGFITS